MSIGQKEKGAGGGVAKAGPVVFFPMQIFTPQKKSVESETQ